MNVEDVVAAKIEAARRKIAARKEDRAAFAAARSKGLARRHAAKLRQRPRPTEGATPDRQKAPEPQASEAFPPEPDPHQSP